jgi:hypothetical protein
MKVVNALLLILALAVGALVLIPIVGLAIAVAVPVLAAIIWFLPILIILCSDKTTGAEKLAWILAIVFLSWFAWIFYFLLAPIKPRDEPYGHLDYRPYRWR